MYITQIIIELQVGFIFRMIEVGNDRQVRYLLGRGTL